MLKSLLSVDLEKIALRYSTDKGSWGHNYARRYEHHFSHLRRKPLRILEIGVLGGASLRMWEDYFPKAEIFAIDIDPALKRHESARSKIFTGDQSDHNFLDHVLAHTGPLDIVIDDGSHVEKHQKASFEKLFPVVKSGGIYVIEDLHTSYWPDYNAIGINEFLKTLVDDVNLRGKSGWGDVRNDPDKEKVLPMLTGLEDKIDAIHFYKSIVFINKA